MSETVNVCPECDHSHISVRQPQKPDGNYVSKGKWFCQECTAYFDDPDTRPPKGTPGNLTTGTGPAPGTLAYKLLHADPDEVSR